MKNLFKSTLQLTLIFFMSVFAFSQNPVLNRRLAFVPRSVVSPTVDPNIQATGGFITYTNNLKVHTFSSTTAFNETFELINNPTSYSLNILVQGGGGSGGGRAGGGGGGYTYFSSTWSPSPSILAVKVGSGNVATSAYGDNGDSSYVGSIVAKGGGGGAAPDLPTNYGLNGGNGGGAYYTGGVPGTGLQGFNGGSAPDGYWYTSGGGGGSGGAGQNGVAQASCSCAKSGDGGPGRLVTIEGYTAYYGGGGAGGYYPLTGVVTQSLAVGGIGGGGSAVSGTVGGSGVHGLGGGGAGGSYDEGSGVTFVGGNGGDGVVKVSYPWTGDSVDYAFKIDTLKQNVSGVIGRDSGLFIKVDSTRMLLVGGWNNGAFFSTNNVTKECYITSDGINFSAVDSFPVPVDHCFGGVRNDGFLWVVGTTNSGSVCVAKFNRNTLTWTAVNDTCVLPYSLFGCVHKDTLYMAVNGGSGVIHWMQSYNGINWTIVSNLPTLYSYQAGCYSDGVNIRYGGGCDFSGSSVVNLNDSVYTSADNGRTWQASVKLPDLARGAWPTMLSYKGYEFIFSGFNNANTTAQGALFYRLKNGDTWAYSPVVSAGSAPKHALCAAVWRGLVYFGFGSILSFNNTYKIYR